MSLLWFDNMSITNHSQFQLGYSLSIVGSCIYVAMPQFSGMNRFTTFSSKHPPSLGVMVYN